ncbi:prepilin-type N-terminal cleavage/methylation domain-containing protein [Alienimonas chondri]|uniref:Type II secretion system protein J n=1 Tax=Alienimonas chondri TaxID=2681879 RepID=A0ABX1VE70_9PLAN|nr:prepilin-type N-terminal cleavage/methylation domain-containing protein [Alienimonas chondri]NNJ25716.1 hypothetical protein [Alienimonas chondri]
MRAPAHRASGFTLIEVLLAMGLLVVVMAGVYAGLETFRRVTTMGRDASAEQQIARAIRSRLLTDLRSVRFAEPLAVEDETPADDSASADGSSLDSSTSSVSSTVADTDEGTGELLPVPLVGLIGDAETLTLYTTLPPRDGASAPARESDLRTVTWFLAGQGGAVSTAVAERDGAGLARSEADTSAVVSAEETNDLNSLILAAETLAPEVTGMAVRYFDGVDWVDSWDSTFSGSLPRAVEVSLEIDLDGPPNAYVAGGEIGNRAPVVTRLVVCPPLSEPNAEAGL